MSEETREAMSEAEAARSVMQIGATRAAMAGSSPAFSHGQFDVFQPVILNAPPGVDSGRLLAAAFALAEKRLKGELKRVRDLQAEIILPQIDVSVADGRRAEEKIADVIVKAVEAACKEQVVPLSFMDRASLGKYASGFSKQAAAQVYFEIMRDLAEELLGSRSKATYSNINVTNLHKVISLWNQQRAHGSKLKTALSLPASLVLGFIGGVQGAPIENARLEGEGKDTRLKDVSATGHGANVVGQLISAAAIMTAMATGVATMGPLLALFGIGMLAPTGAVAPLLRQRFGEANAPVHEMAHSIQFLTLGYVLRAGIIDAQDYYDIQNDMNVIGYLWGGKTESEGAIAAEKGVAVKPIFDTLRTLGKKHLEKRYKGEALRLKRYEDGVSSVEQKIQGRFRGRGV